jgi:hypothetical protein
MKLRRPSRMRDMDLLPALIRNYNDKLAGLVEDGHPDSGIVLDSSSGIAGAVSVEMLSGYESDVQLCFVARDHVYCIVAHPDCLVCAQCLFTAPKPHSASLVRRGRGRCQGCRVDYRRLARR